MNPSLATAAADYAFGTSANTLWSSVNTTSSSFKWFGGNTLAATLTGGGNLTLGGAGSIKARNVIPSSINLTTAGATTTLTSTSHYYQNSTVAQTIKLPVVTTLSNGHQFFIKNSSTQPVTVQTSAGTALQVMAANATLELTCINTAGGTGTASWHWVYNTNTAGGSGGSSQWTTTGSDIAYNAGKVGIGTATPSEKLEIQEANDTPTVLKISNTNAGSNSMVSLKLKANNTEASFFARNETPGGYGEFAPNRAGISNGGPIALITTNNTSPINFAPNFNTKMTVMPDGNVGIGTNSPQNKLDVNGAINISAGGLAAPPAGLGYGLFPHANVGIGTYSANGGISFWGGTTPTEYMRIMNGNMGIGKTPTSYKLDVEGTINATSILVGGLPISTGSSQWTTTGSNISFGTGNVGIGALANDAKLSVNLVNPSGWSGNLKALKITSPDNAYYLDVNTYVVESGNVGYHFSPNGNTGMSLTTAGRVGIGTSSPSEKLEVNGNINVGVNSGAATGWGNRLYFRGVDDAQGFDPIWMSRYNVAANQTDLRINIGDDASGDDSFTVGNFFSGDGQWKTFMKVQNNGNVGIGTANPTQKLTVKGTVYSTEVKVDLSAGAPDYVFEKEYNLPTLDSIKAYIDKNKHLPEVPSAKEFEKNGVNLGEMNMLLLKKIEELTLLMIQQEKRIKELENKKQ